MYILVYIHIQELRADKLSIMGRRGVYSQKYDFHNTQVKFDCGGSSIAKAPHGTLSTDGIDKSMPKRYTSDKETVKEQVQGARPRALKKVQEPRNPLSPTYKWPVEYQTPPEEVKFLRDSMNVSDIDGAAVKSPPKASSRAELLLNVGDINYPHT